MRRAAIVLVVLCAAFTAFVGTASAKQPPKSDLDAQYACSKIQEMRVLGVNQDGIQLLIGLLDESRTVGTQKYANQLLNAPSEAAQGAITDRIETWCYRVLKIRCNGFLKCVGGRRVENL